MPHRAEPAPGPADESVLDAIDADIAAHQRELDRLLDSVDAVAAREQADEEEAERQHKAVLHKQLVKAAARVNRVSDQLVGHARGLGPLVDEIRAAVMEANNICDKLGCPVPLGFRSFEDRLGGALADTLGFEFRSVYIQTAQYGGDAAKAADTKMPDYSGIIEATKPSV